MLKMARSKIMKFELIVSGNDHLTHLPSDWIQATIGYHGYHYKKKRSLVNDTVELTCWFSFYLANTFEPHLEWMISSVIQVSA